MEYLSLILTGLFLGVGVAITILIFGGLSLVILKLMVDLINAVKLRKSRYIELGKKMDRIQEEINKREVGKCQK